jgi:hypothetical protein
MSPTLGLDGLRSALSTPTHVRLEEGYRRLSLDARPDHGRHTALDCQERKCNCADAPLNAGALRMRLSHSPALVYICTCEHSLSKHGGGKIMPASNETVDMIIFNKGSILACTSR